jgi:hypothetical protein
MSTLQQRPDQRAAHPPTRPDVSRDDDRATWLKRQGRRAYEAIERGTLADIAEFIAPGWENAEAAAESPAARQPGPAGFAGTVRWLRRAYSDIRFVEHEAVAEGDLVISRVTMHGRQTGPLVLQDGAAVRVIPPSDRTFAVDQVHVTRFDSTGRAVHHDAVRDDLGQLIQLGQFPPSPAALWRQLVWAVTGRSAAARRAFLEDKPPTG